MKRSTFSRLAFFGLLLSMLFVVTQCSGPVSQSPTAQPTTAGGQATPSAGKVKIVYWSFFSEGEPLQIVYNKATQDFMKENPDIEVEIKWAGRQVLTQLQSALAAGTQVDVVDQNDSYLSNALVKPGLALSMDKYLNEKAYDSDKLWKDTFVPGALELGKGADGQVYMIPREDYIAGFFYNVKMLDELGIHPSPTETTWQDFLSMLATIREKKPDVSPLGVDTSIGFLNNWYYTYLAVRLAGPQALFDAASDKTGEKWGQPEFLQAAKMLREDILDKNYFQDKYEGSVWPSSQVLWVNGKTAMMFMGAWLPSEMSQQMPPGFDLSMFAFPNIEGGKGNDIVEHWGNMFTVLKSSKNPDAAVRWIKYIMTAKVGAEISKTGTPSPIIGVPPPPGLKNQNVILEAFKGAHQRFGLNDDLPEYTDKVYNTCDDKLFKKQVSPEEFIACLKTESKAYWANK